MGRREWKEAQIRIAFLIDSITCDTAGTQKQLLETIRRLDRERFAPYLICLSNSEWLTQNSPPCPCIILGYQGFLKWSFPTVIKKLTQVIRERRLQIIQTFFEDSIFVGFLGKLFTGNSLVLLSSRRDMGLGNENSPWYHSLFTIALPYVNRSFAGIIANSEQVRLYVAEREKTVPDKIKVIPNGISVPDKSDHSPPIFSTNSNVIWIGMVASLTPVKRHDVLIRAVAELQCLGTQQEFRVLLIGEGPELEHLSNLVKHYDLKNQIYFTGSVKTVPAYLHNLDIGVLCSDREGLSNAILEYMACGLPIVATTVGGNIELVNHENGICCPAGDYRAIGQALHRLIENPDLRHRLGAESLKKIERSFSWIKTIAETEKYYRSLVRIEI
ncbi:glycosyltransferase [Desulfosediminicola sp.]|uniref:glycosyltransferase n=1 Tax=Desulfosediminicola sp. TaxID=2886825 RepID=UPI003AF26A36